MTHSRWTDRARKVMQLANQEAQRFNHEYVGTEHILLGLLKEGNNVAVQILCNLGAEPFNVGREVVRKWRNGGLPTIRIGLQYWTTIQAVENFLNEKLYPTRTTKNAVR